MNENLSQPNQEKHLCENCGKEIKLDEHFTLEDKKYCCEKCCKINTPEMKKTANVCEFC
jgi:hypothetical protein